MVPLVMTCYDYAVTGVDTMAMFAVNLVTALALALGVSREYHILLDRLGTSQHISAQLSQFLQPLESLLLDYFRNNMEHV